MAWRSGCRQCWLSAAVRWARRKALQGQLLLLLLLLPLRRNGAGSIAPATASALTPCEAPAKHPAGAPAWNLPAAAMAEALRTSAKL
jgi:hypothetical protein